MNRILFVLSVLSCLVSCAQKEPQKSPEQEIPLKWEPSPRPSLIEKKLPQNDLGNTIDIFSKKSKTVDIENEYGGGDCLGTYKQYHTLNDTTLVIDHMDCGEYGFTLKTYLTQEEKPLLTRKVNKEWIITDSIPYTLQEWFYDFSDSTQYYYREYKFAQYKDTEILASIPFDTIQQENGSLFLKDLQETLAKETEKLME